MESPSETDAYTGTDQGFRGEGGVKWEGTDLRRGVQMDPPLLHIDTCMYDYADANFT